jgi:hypothetical protein
MSPIVVFNIILTHIKTHSPTQPLWSLPVSERTVITSAGFPLKGELSDVVTTEGIYWFDGRYPGKPVLGIKHYRDFDRTLDARTFLLRRGAEVDSRPVTFLISKRTGLVSVYDVSRGEDDLVHMNAPSHCLPSITPHGGLPVAGWNLFKHPLMDPSHVDVLHLSSRGDINRLHAQFHPDGEADPTTSDYNQGFIWDDDLKEFASASLAATGSDRLAERESLTVDLGPAYQGGTSPFVMFSTNLLTHPKIFSSLQLKKERTSKLRTMLWTASPPSGKISMSQSTTLYQCQRCQLRYGPFPDYISSRNDIACRLGDDPPDTHRSDFLSPNPITGKRGYRAWTQGRLSPQEISRSSNWNLDLSEILKSSAPDFSDDANAMMNELQSHSLSLDDDRVEASLKLENDACEQLALDLGMSSHVYASKTFSRPDSVPRGQAQSFEDVVADVSLATGALSINASGPPPVHFGFLSPIATQPVDSDLRDTGPDEPGTSQTGEADLIPLGVRLLMDEWKIGEDPKDHKYFDPYGDNASSPTEARPKLGGESIPDQSQPVDPTPRLNPPTVVTARVPPLVALSKTAELKKREKNTTGGGSTQDNPLQTKGPSQDAMMVGTQVEPGKFGDRKAGQKVRQKRVGGF